MYVVIRRYVAIDTLNIFHVYDVVKQGHSKIMIHTVDINEVILTFTAYFTINKRNVIDLLMSYAWIVFGNRKRFRYIPCHKLAIYIDS